MAKAVFTESVEMSFCLLGRLTRSAEGRLRVGRKGSGVSEMGGSKMNVL